MINTITCKSCNTLTSVQTTVDFVNFACPSCGSVCDLKSANQTHIKKYTYKPLDIIFPIGLKGVFDDKEFEIINVLVKFLGAFTYAKEYTLVSKDEQYIYLSECNGHWIQLKQVDDIELKKSGNLSIKYKDIIYNKFDYYTPTLMRAYGFFDFDLKKFDNFVVEYIQPPFILATETINAEAVTYLGQHISKTKIKQIFKNQSVPTKNGYGVVQPFLFNLQHTALLFCATIIFVLITHLCINQERSQEDVLFTSINFNEFKDKDYVSPSFTLEGSSAPLKIDLASGVSNSWAWVGLSVINENTNEEIFAEQDIEYYSGYEGGESWSEGTSSPDFYICGLGPGKYHLAIKASKQDTDYSNENVQVTAKWGDASNWNFGVIIVSLFGIFLAIYFARNYFERTRWSESSYSPYIE